MAHKMTGSEKRRHISFVAYVPDECLEWTEDGYKVTDPEGVERRYDEICAELDGQRVKCCISPLHFADTYDEKSVAKWLKNHADKNGEISDEDAARAPKVGDTKKPHWHIYYYSPGGRTLSGMRKLFAALVTPGQSFWVEDDASSAIRYQAHLDSPSKAAYDPMQVQPFGGLDISCLWKADGITKLSTVQAICSYIQERECTNGYDLTNFVLSMEDPTMFDCLISRVPFFSFYMEGLQRKLSKQEKMASEGKA